MIDSGHLKAAVGVAHICSLLKPRRSRQNGGLNTWTGSSSSLPLVSKHLQCCCPPCANMSEDLVAGPNPDLVVSSVHSLWSGSWVVLTQGHFERTESWYRLYPFQEASDSGSIRSRGSKRAASFPRTFKALIAKNLLVDWDTWMLKVIQLCLDIDSMLGLVPLRL